MKPALPFPRSHEGDKDMPSCTLNDLVILLDVVREELAKFHGGSYVTPNPGLLDADAVALKDEITTYGTSTPLVDAAMPRGGAGSRGCNLC
jgi:hypothetical protein